MDLDEYRKPSIEEEISPVGKFFGGTLQVAVWCCTVGYSSYSAIRHFTAGEAEEVGVLGVVPAGALLLFSTFAAWRFYLSKKAEAEKATKM